MVYFIIWINHILSNEGILISTFRYKLQSHDKCTYIYIACIYVVTGNNNIASRLSHNQTSQNPIKPASEPQQGVLSPPPSQAKPPQAAGSRIAPGVSAAAAASPIDPSASIFPGGGGVGRGAGADRDVLPTVTSAGCQIPPTDAPRCRPAGGWPARPGYGRQTCWRDIRWGGFLSGDGTDRDWISHIAVL